MIVAVLLGVERTRRRAAYSQQRAVENEQAETAIKVLLLLLAPGTDVESLRRLADYYAYLKEKYRLRGSVALVEYRALSVDGRSEQPGESPGEPPCHCLAPRLRRWMVVVAVVGAGDQRRAPASSQAAAR